MHSISKNVIRYSLHSFESFSAITLVSRNNAITSGFAIITNIPTINSAFCNIFGILFIHPNNTSDALCHLNDVKISQEYCMSESTNIDTF